MDQMLEHCWEIHLAQHLEKQMAHCSGKHLDRWWDQKLAQHLAQHWG